jgi:hypothetical protein
MEKSKGKEGMFSGATGQYIDSHGKTRMLVYKNGVCLMTSPIPPLSLKRITLNDITPVTLEEAVAFCERRGLQITSQDGSQKEGTQGIWVEPMQENPGIYYGYIPLKKIRFIKDTPISQRNDPLRTDTTSELSQYRRNKKVADVLKYYTLYTYANSPENFGPARYVVNPKHTYDLDAIHKKFIKDTPVIYSKGKIIVPTEGTRDNLLSYLQAMVANDRDGVLALKDAVTIDGYYQTLSDFRAPDTQTQLLFASKNAVMMWRNSKILEEGKVRTEVLDTEDPDTLEPYYYRNPKIRREHLMIVQNVIEGDMSRAISVAYKWLRDNTNALADCEVLANVSEISYIVYSKSNGFVEKRYPQTTKESVSLIEYEDGKFGALLFFP